MGNFLIMFIEYSIPIRDVIIKPVVISQNTTVLNLGKDIFHILLDQPGGDT